MASHLDVRFQRGILPSDFATAIRYAFLTKFSFLEKHASDL